MRPILIILSALGAAILVLNLLKIWNTGLLNGAARLRLTACP